MEEKIKDNKSWWQCTCGNKLGKTIGKDIIEITGLNGQKYDIGFNYITLNCRKCGGKNSLTGTSSEIELKEPSFFELPTYYRNILLSQLSETQKRIYGLLSDYKSAEEVSEDEIKKMLEDTGLTKEKIIVDIKIIIEQIKSPKMILENSLEFELKAPV